MQINKIKKKELELHTSRGLASLSISMSLSSSTVFLKASSASPLAAHMKVVLFLDPNTRFQIFDFE